MRVLSHRSGAFRRRRRGPPRMIPGWLPEVAVTYLAHTSAGMPIRALARAKGCHASTVLRQVRRVEAWRDDPLVDEALERMARAHAADCVRSAVSKEEPSMPSRPQKPAGTPDPRVEREARRILRRLCEKGAFLAVAPTHGEGGGAARGGAGAAEPHRGGRPRRGARLRAAGVDRLRTAGKIACYTITAVGRAALKRLLTEERVGRAPAEGFAEAPTPFQEQHRFFAERTVMADDGSGERRLRFNLAESPLSVLGPQARQGRRGLSDART